MKRTIKLDQFEEDVEAHIEDYLPVTGKKREHIEAVLERGRKTKNINIRISEDDLLNLKRRAKDEGIPYQTLIASVLHKYITDRFIDEKDIVKSLELLGKQLD